MQDLDITPAGAFLEEAERLWPAHDFGFYRFVEDGVEHGAFCFDDIDEEDTVVLSLVKVRRGFRGQGVGGRMLDAACALADKHCIALSIELVPDPGICIDRLRTWYQSRGFEDCDALYAREGPPMSRSPQIAAEPTFP